ncbi:MAG: hypothetical protein A3K09_01670 [Nitrospinae bacterium RIFCSPLOWO2_12_FULL_47_7]|nr:MAG: hypothetical protein A3K09_01670 [Nitrospinae bacterium RIFCSPLOWO2_12_FULL_47_7]
MACLNSEGFEKNGVKKAKGVFAGFELSGKGLSLIVIGLFLVSIKPFLTMVYGNLKISIPQ